MLTFIIDVHTSVPMQQKSPELHRAEDLRALDPQQSQASMTQGQDGLSCRNVRFFYPCTTVPPSNESTKEQKWTRRNRQEGS